MQGISGRGFDIASRSSLSKAGMVAAVFAVVAALHVSVATPLPIQLLQGDNCGQTATPTYWFQGNGWSDQTRRTDVTDGFDRWLTFKDADGSGLTSYSVDQTSPDFWVEWDWNGSEVGSGDAIMRCGMDPPVMYLNDDLIDDRDLLTSVTSHEYGHAIGLRHTGLDNSFDGLVPLMSTCLTKPGDTPPPPLQTEREATQDDAAALLHIWSTVAGENGMVGNSSFERNLNYWALRDSVG